jgi:hypothetical protein
MKLPKLLFWCVVAYAVLLVLLRGALSSEASPTVSLVGIPLIMIIVIIARDLARRSTSPTAAPRIPSQSGFNEDPVKFLSDQIRVAAKASDSYFENILRARLRELLIAKVALEKGLDKDVTRRVLSDPRQGRDLLDNEDLYTVLYGPLPSRQTRTRMVEKTVDLIGAWKG